MVKHIVSTQTEYKCSGNVLHLTFHKHIESKSAVQSTLEKTKKS
jgi:hypothetical protein